jgi:regulator of ribonuclease activity A
LLPSTAATLGGLSDVTASTERQQRVWELHLVRERLEEEGKGRVLVVDGGGSLRCALIGETLARLAHGNGWAGVVVHGAVRDTVALNELDLGVYALGAAPRRSAKEGKGVCDTTVAFGGSTFVPGAVLYCDEDGVAVVPVPKAVSRGGRPSSGLAAGRPI